MKDNLTIVQESYASGKAGDIPGILKDISDDCKWTEMAGHIYAGTFVGRDEILKNVFARIGDEWRDFAAVPGEFLCDGDKVVVLGNYSGTNLNTEKFMDIRFVHVWTLNNGKIVELEQFTDTAILRWAADDHYG